jgi:type VI protein secretion system component Hcp
MRLSTKNHALLATAIAALAVSPAFAAVDAYLKLGDVKGEMAAASAKGGHKDWIEIESVQWGVRVAAGDVNGDGKSDVAVAEKRQHNPMTITKPMDRGSVTLNASVAGCAKGKHYDQATLVTRASRYEFQDVMVTACAAAPTESISFEYGKIVTQASSSADRAMWDLKKQTK